MPIIANQQPNAMQNPATPQGRRQKGTGFTNIRNLLQANVGAGGVMGAGLASGLGQKAGQLSQDVQTAGQQFGQQYQQQKEKTLGQGGSVAGIGGYLTGEQDVSGLSEEEAKKLGENLASAQYTGPTELQNQQALLGRAGNIQALSTLAGMGGIGQGRLLQGSATRRGAYTRGQGLLDQYLVGQDVGAQQAIKAASAEAAGAAQQAQTSADVAAQQAEGLKTSIEAQKEQTKQDVLKALAGTQESATQGAKQFLAQADRIKKAIATMGGEEGIPLDQLNAEDLAALQNLQAYGINPATVTTADDLAGLLKQISASGNVEFTGQQRYGTEEERRAARNLALLSGQEDVAKKISGTEFDPGVFSDANSKIKAQVEASAKTTDDVKTDLNATGNTFWVPGPKGYKERITANDLTPENVKKVIDDYNSSVNLHSSGGRRDIAYDQFGLSIVAVPNDDPSGKFVRAAYRLLGKDKVQSLYDKIEEDEGGWFGSSTEYKANRFFDGLRDQLNNTLSKLNVLNNRYDSRTTLQDYINTRLGVMPQQGS
jgi:hypothetical protein